jgi:ubiquinone/menaquinone biosynthesis C-methylase UbiE
VLLNELSEIFDRKYASYSWHQDARAAVQNWQATFLGILGRHLTKPVDQLRMLAVGAGSGNEAANVWSGFGCNIALVDIGRELVQNCAREAPLAIVHRLRAENLTALNDSSVDVFCALRTFESTFFDIAGSLAEAYRVLDRKGTIIISISNGYLTSSGTIAHGQLEAGGSLDVFLPWRRLLGIASAAKRSGFVRFESFDLDSEIGFCAIKD